MIKMKNDRRKTQRRTTRRNQPDRRAIYRLGILSRYGINWVAIGQITALEQEREKNADKITAKKAWDKTIEKWDKTIEKWSNADLDIDDLLNSYNFGCPINAKNEEQHYCKSFPLFLKLVDLRDNYDYDDSFNSVKVQVLRKKCLAWLLKLRLIFSALALGLFLYYFMLLISLMASGRLA